MSGKFNTLTVDDATVVMTNTTAWTENGALAIGRNETNHRGTNATLVVVGRQPCIRLPDGGLTVCNESKLVFRLPKEGYEEGAVPIVTGKECYIGASDRLVLEGAEEMLAYHADVIGAKRRYVLMHMPKLNIPANVLAAAADSLPDRVMLSLVASAKGGQDLVLDVKPETGLILLFR